MYEDVIPYGDYHARIRARTKGMPSERSFMKTTPWQMRYIP